MPEVSEQTEETGGNRIAELHGPKKVPRLALEHQATLGTGLVHIDAAGKDSAAPTMRTALAEQGNPGGRHGGDLLVSAHSFDSTWGAIAQGHAYACFAS